MGRFKARYWWTAELQPWSLDLCRHAAYMSEWELAARPSWVPALSLSGADTRGRVFTHIGDPGQRRKPAQT